LNKGGIYRGSSAIKGAVNLLINVESKKGQMEIKFDVEKNQDGEETVFKGSANFFQDKFWLSSTEPTPEPIKLSKGQKFVLRWLKEHGAQTVSEIINNADTCPPATARQAIYALADMSAVRRADGGEKRESATYTLTDKGREMAENAG
jgi:DNA-binding MarR family transcriptional regulator